MAGLYFHIPFCKKACYYCDFHFSTNQELKTQVVEAICKELFLQKNYLPDESIQTVYFGGGTPSLLNESELALIFDEIKKHYSLVESPEVTLEANPDDLSINKLKGLKSLGVNRLSIGFQTFNDQLLKYLNRSHTRETALQSFNNARQTGFKNISVDLIYGIPNQTNETLLDDLKLLISLKPEHISCYSLTIEERTVFGNWHQSGKLKIVDDEFVAHQMELIISELTAAGYEHYEVSNFSKPGCHSKHNSSYWKQRYYLGVGPSAHSYNGNSRQYNVSNNHKYVSSIKEGIVPYEIEMLTKEDKVNEFLLTTLRTSWGCNLKLLKQDFDYDLITNQTDYIDNLLKSNLAVIKNDHLILTSKGKLIADRISSDLFLIAS